MELSNNGSDPGEMRKYRRTIFRGDFRECDRFVQYMLPRKLYEKTSGQLNLIRSAFETALVISYCRPFGNNKNLSGDGHSSLTHAIDNVLLDEGERQLHFLIKERRNRLYAHSQASTHVVPGFNYEDSALHLMIVQEPLTEQQLLVLRTMIKKWRTHLKRQQPRRP